MIPQQGTGVSLRRGVFGGPWCGKKKGVQRFVDFICPTAVVALHFGQFRFAFDETWVGQGACLLPGNAGAPGTPPAG